MMTETRKCRFCGESLRAVETTLPAEKFECSACGHTHFLFDESRSLVTGLVIAHDRECCDAVFTPVTKRGIAR